MYVVLEGSNNVGKSTVLPRVKHLLKEYFNEYDKENVTINIFHEGDTCSEHHNNFYEAVLDYARDRAKLQQDIWGNEYVNITISDRSYYSSLVYQGKGNREQITYVRTVNQFAKEPCLIFYLWNDNDNRLHNLYEDVLPFGRVWHMWTKVKDVESTVEEIAEIIFLRWLEMYTDLSDEEQAHELRDIKNKLIEKKR